MPRASHVGLSMCSFLSLIVEEIVEVVKTVLQEQISEDPHTDRGRQRVTDGRAGYRSSQDFKPRPNLTVYSGTDSRCSRAGNGETVVGSAGDRFRGQNPAADCGADR